ncbi:MAG TPA: flagellar biosynthetic protein FliO [Rhizomicrobium sp.]|nr:flagellar biosynthetic protein FliO [Rhizomicrobium sp.]
MDLFNVFQYATALILVLALAAAALLIKRYGNNPAAFKDGLKGKLGNWSFTAPERRLAVVESLMVGPKQRVMIIRRDNVEHVVFATGEGATVIESNIQAKAPAP